MKRCLQGLAVALLLSLVGSSFFAQTKPAAPVPLADLFPTNTLAYFELCQPDKLADELLALTKGSVLEDMPGAFAKAREKFKGRDGRFTFWQMHTMALFLDPELLRDVRRAHGAAIGITGITSEGPEFVAVIQTGDSAFPRLMMRSIMLMENLSVAGRVGDVAIYHSKIERHRFDRFDKDKFREKDDKPAKPAADEYGPAMALAPGLMVIGTNKDGVRDVLLRAKGDKPDPAFSSLDAISKTAKLREKPGIFMHTSPSLLAAKFDKIDKSMDWRVIKEILAPQGILNTTSMLTLEKGTLQFKTEAKLKKEAKVPIIDLFGDKKADPKLLAYVPTNSMIAGVINLEDGTARMEAFLKAMDAIHAREGIVKPTSILESLEEALKMKLGKDIVAQLTSAAFLVDMSDDKATPMLIARAKDAATATTLIEKTIPAMLKAANDGREAPSSTDKIGGQSVTSWAMRFGPDMPAVCVGRNKGVIVIGSNKARVAESLSAAEKKAGMLSDARVSEAFKETEAVMVGVMSLGTAITGMYRQAVSPPMRRYYEKEKFEKKDFRDKEKEGKFDEKKCGDSTEVEVAYRQPDRRGDKPPAYVEKGTKEMMKALTALAPLLMTLHRKGETVTLELKQPGLRGVSAKAIDVWIDGMFHHAAWQSGLLRDDDKMPAPLEKDKK